MKMEHFQSSEKVWQKDETSKCCNKCGVGFNLFTWKHHCRSCGKIFCESCCSNFMKLPSREICFDSPALISTLEFQRCCSLCTSRIKSQQETVVSVQNDSQYVNTVNTLEYRYDVASRLYMICLPLHARTHQILRVLVDNRLMHIRVPPGARPGQQIRIRANAPGVTITYVSFTRLDDVCDLTIDAADHDDGEVDESTGFIECSSCTYHNRLGRNKCAMCDKLLLS